jgi:preprotein translocase subunit Sec63
LPKSYLISKEDLLKAENELKLAEAKLEAQKRESEKQVLEAQNDKKVKIIEAESIAEYNKIVNNINQKSIDLKKLELEKLRIEKWD